MFCFFSHSSSNITAIFITYFFPVSIAGLKLTFPSRTRLIRGLATMVLHIRVWESSSMPGFFLPKFWAKKHVIHQDYASCSVAALHIFHKKNASCTAGALHKKFLIRDLFPVSGFFLPKFWAKNHVIP